MKMSRGRMRELKGVVIKNSSDKTVTVQTETSNKNRIYNKIVVMKKKFHVHDEKNEAKVGDEIRAIETKPISKSKRWKLVEVINKGEAL
tara:strand:- start:9435 stop:9701 length:267 start_codon:yes stop_codon:yes gene_type:complete